MLLTRQSLCQAVYYYICSRDLFNINPSFTNFLAEPVVIDIDVSKLGVKLSVAFSEKSNRLHIIAVNYLLFVSVESNFFKESLPPNRLGSCMQQS